MDRWWQAAGVVGVALLFGWEITNAVDVAVAAAGEEPTFDFDLPALPLGDHVHPCREGFHDLLVQQPSTAP